MRIVSLIVCGVLALPALAQESKPTPKPNLPACFPMDGPTLRGTVAHVGAHCRLVTVTVTDNPSGTEIKPGYAFAIYEGGTYKGDAVVQEADNKREVAFCRVFNPVKGTTIKVGDAASTEGTGSTVAKLSEAELEAGMALLAIQEIANKAMYADDLNTKLKALDEIEKAVMRARAALHKAKAKDETEAKDKAHVSERR